MAEEIKVLGTYQGYDWGLYGWDNQFVVIETEKRYSSYAQMTEALDRLIKSKERSVKQKLDIHALASASGASYVITGVHSGHGNIITKPKVENRDYDLVVDVAWIRDAIVEQNRLRERAEAIGLVLERFEIKTGFHRYDNGFDYAKAIENVISSSKSALERAEKTNLEKELAKRK